MLQQGGNLISGRVYLTLDGHEIGRMLIFQLLEKVKIFPIAVAPNRRLTDF
jgi:hypothetical protein